MKRQSSIIIVTLMLSVAFHASLALAKGKTAKGFVAEAKKSITTISVAEAKALFDKGGVVFLDVREQKEFKAGHIPDAINVPRGLLEWKIGKEIRSKNAEVVVYCTVGARSCLATDTLAKMGYRNVRNMDGGWKAWIKAGYPVE